MNSNYTLTEGPPGQWTLSDGDPSGKIQITVWAASGSEAMDTVMAANIAVWGQIVKGQLHALPLSAWTVADGNGMRSRIAPF